MSRSRKKGEGPPPIPLLHQGARLTDREFGDAYASLGEFIIFEALDNEMQPLGYAIGQITNMYPFDDNGAHITLDYIGVENEFYRWYVENIDAPGGLPSSYTHHLCRKAVTSCARKEDEE